MKHKGIICEPTWQMSQKRSLGYLFSLWNWPISCNMTHGCICLKGMTFLKHKEGTGYPLQYSWSSQLTQVVKNLLQCWTPGFDPWIRKIPWRRAWLPTPVFWPGEFHGLFHGVAKSQTQLSDFPSLHIVYVTLTPYVFHGIKFKCFPLHLKFYALKSSWVNKMLGLESLTYDVD